MPKLVNGRVDPLEAGEEASTILSRGGVAVFPTETVYGVGAAVEDYHAVARVFQLKSRPPETPLTIHVSSLEQALRYIEPLSPSFWSLVDLWPGPLTVIEPASPRAPMFIRAWGPRVGVRVPDHPATLKAIELAGPIVGPSANPSGRPSPVEVRHAIGYFGDKVDVYIDGGEARYGLESTIVEDLGGNVYRVLRAGAMPVDRLEELGVKIVLTNEARGVAPRAGGYRRYRVPFKLVVVDPGETFDEDTVADCLGRLVVEAREKKLKTLVLAVEEVADTPREAGADVHLLGSIRDPVGVGKALSKTLVEFTLNPPGYDIVLAEAFGEKGYWLAVTAKIREASGGLTVEPRRGCRLPLDTV